ncbi:MAG: L,D-transpeptidase [Bacteroidales bacterium]|nr:MAG: L,D-transpeptidase [Bacteroidales bacterium]
MKLRLILIALMALLAFNASETSLADNNTRTSGNTTTGTGYFQNGRPFVVISKEEMKMRVYDATGRELRCYPIACGRNVGNKRRQGDMRTPVGLFKVQEILDAHTWTHDFKDGKGVIRGAYGPYFVRLLTGHKGIGIHGTHDESSIGTLATEGCIRLHNANILEFATNLPTAECP